jgi:predicted GIY-YIG superfamily endonuclease
MRAILLMPVFVWLLSFAAYADDGKSAAANETLDAAAKKRLKDVVRLAFTETHDGWSSDEVILQDELNAKFLAACQKRMPEATAFDANWLLLNLRKAGELSDIKSTRRNNDRHDDYLHAAEIVARFLEDKHSTNTDRVICDPKLRAEFDALTKPLAPDVAAYKLRKAAFALRKSRRLSPELVLRVASWKKEVIAHPAEKLAADPKLVPDGPGVYIFRDATGYLYVGESSELRTRLKKHLDKSDRQSLAQYLSEKGIKDITVEVHVFDATSDAKLKPMRRAYESELIRSRKPRFNLAS